MTKSRHSANGPEEEFDGVRKRKASDNWQQKRTKRERVSYETKLTSGNEADHNQGAMAEVGARLRMLNGAGCSGSNVQPVFFWDLSRGVSSGRGDVRRKCLMSLSA